MNNLYDKIAVLYGDLNNNDIAKAISSGSFWSSSNRVIINDFAYIDNTDLVHINLGEDSAISIEHLIIVDPETGEDIECFPYADMGEGEFFQLTTVHDFGNLTYEEILFAKKHMENITNLGHTFKNVVYEYVSNMFKDMTDKMVKEIQQETDDQILRSMYGMAARSINNP